MPRGDYTGPRGEGPMTGHGGGWCAVPAEQAFGSMDQNKRAGSCRKRPVRARKRLQSCRVDRGKKAQ